MNVIPTFPLLISFLCAELRGGEHDFIHGRCKVIGNFVAWTQVGCCVACLHRCVHGCCEHRVEASNLPLNDPESVFTVLSGGDETVELSSVSTRMWAE